MLTSSAGRRTAYPSTTERHGTTLAVVVAMELLRMKAHGILRLVMSFDRNSQSLSNGGAKLFRSEISILFGLMIISFFSQAMVLADDFRNPLLQGRRIESTYDGQVFANNYKGPNISKALSNRTSALLAFTLYSDGKVRWIRPFHNAESLTDDVFESLKKALLLSCPLVDLVKDKNPDKARPMWLTGRLSSEGQTVFGFSDLSTAARGYYKYRLNSSQVKQQWTKANLAKILQNFRSGSKPFDFAHRIVAIWFYINPDGSSDSFEILYPSSHSVNIVPENSISSRLVSAIKKSCPLIYQSTSSDVGAPRSVILIFDEMASKLVTVDGNSADLLFSVQ
jgi:hypothetical protein